MCIAQDLNKAFQKILNPPPPLPEDRPSMKLARHYWSLDRTARAYLREAGEWEIQVNRWGHTDCIPAMRQAQGSADALFLARGLIADLAREMGISMAEWEQAWRQAQPQD